MPKASERMFETNYCAQRTVSDYSHVRRLWMTPSQAREHYLGYDTGVVSPFGIELLQFKVPKKRLSRPRSPGSLPCLRIDVPHDQIVALAAVAGPQIYCAVVFPDLVEESEYVTVGWDLLSHTYELDVTDVASIAAPGRQSGTHLGDFRPRDRTITLHSEPLVGTAMISAEREPRLADEPLNRNAIAEVFGDLPRGTVVSALYRPGQLD